jgi:nucleotide-binding universal stress UspA family protein
LGKEPHTIVIAVDASERSPDALALGRLLADSTAAPVVLMSVFPHDPLADPADAMYTRAREEALSILVELGEQAGLVAPDAQVIAGNFAARELQRVSEQQATGVIVLGSTHRGPVGRLLPGGVGERLLTGAACPIAIAPRGYADDPPARLTRIGVAFDGSDESHQALSAARQLARSSGAKLRVISVLERLTFGTVATGRTGGASINERMRAEQREALAEVAAGQPDEEMEPRLLEGSPGDALAEESADLDLLVTGSRGYGPRAAVLLGTTTHTLMRKAACPGLILPRGTSLKLAPSAA